MNMHALFPVKRQNLYEQVIEHLKRYIAENGLGPGDRLPTEAALAEHLGVSRLTVREALKVMQSTGIIQMRPRDGCRLQVPTMAPLMNHFRFVLNTKGLTFVELLDARRILENALLPVIAERADGNDFAQMEESNERMRALAAQGEAVIDADITFHQALAAATKNRALEGFGAMLQEFFRQARAQGLSENTIRWEAIEEHRQICEALRKRDIATAQRIMHKHLGRYDRFTGPAEHPEAPGASLTGDEAPQ